MVTPFTFRPADPCAAGPREAGVVRILTLAPFAQIVDHMHASKWSDVNLSGLVVDVESSHVRFEILSSFDGHTLAIVTCNGVLAIAIHSCLAPRAMPCMVGHVEIKTHPQADFPALLNSTGVSFFQHSAFQNHEIGEVFSVRIEGGELDVVLITATCEIQEAR